MALVSRVYPDPSSSTGKVEVRKIMTAAERNNPGLLEEMRADQLQTLMQYRDHVSKLPTWDFLRVNGPIVSGAVRRFVAKLGLALHYSATNKVVPEHGGVVVSWYSNVDSFTGKGPGLLPYLGPGQTLKAGRSEVSNQFRYSSTASEDGALSGHVAVFRETFAGQMIVMEDISQHPNAPRELLFQPGFLSQP